MYLRRRAVALAAVALVVLVALAASGAFEATPSAPTLALAPASGPAITIGARPIGLSIEYPLLAHDLGSGRCPPPALVSALAALGSPTLRIGGDSQDEVAPAGSAPRPGVRDLPVGFWTRLGCLERETRIPIVVGLNLASGDTAWDVTLAADARLEIPPARLSFELGNEPDIYGSPVKWWNGSTLVSSAMPWAIYLARAAAVAGALGAHAAIEGPDFASGRWIGMLPGLVKTLHPRTLDAHFYALDGCKAPGAATTAALLSRAIQNKLDERVGIVIAARVEHLPALISESNSVSCGGTAGVSDTSAAAVWAVRMILQALRDGFTSVRFHASGRAYDPFVLAGDSVAARPLYLGLVAAAGVLTPGAQLRSIANARALDGVALSTARGTQTVLLSNFAARARWVSLAALARARVLEVVARAPTVLHASVAPSGGRVRVQLPANSLDAITLAPAG